MFLSLDSDLEIVCEATNGYEAVGIAKMLKPDVILMDLMMPQMNGIEATALLRADGIQADIIALSQCQDKRVIEAVMKAGANFFLPKEVHNEELITVIKRVVGV
jgi:DNA-binding NarL/FixJ family response regulator